MRRQSTRASIRSSDLLTHRGKPLRLLSRLVDDHSAAAWQAAIGDPGSMIVLDLFCGAGGLSYGFQEAGFVIGAGIDHDPDACETHAANILSKTCCLDIASFDDADSIRSLVRDQLGLPRVDV